MHRDEGALSCRRTGARDLSVFFILNVPGTVDGLRERMGLNAVCDISLGMSDQVFTAI
jgi:hypothetical protein